MGVTYAFNYAAWAALFPEFASPGGSSPVTESQAQGYFDIASGFFRNDGRGPCNNAATQARLLNLLTAHIAKLMSVPAGQSAPSPLVGRISDAAEGSVHVAVEMPSNLPASAAFFTQTQYGLMFWQLSVPFRTAFYLPNNSSPVNAGTGFGWNGSYSGGYLGGNSWVP